MTFCEWLARQADRDDPIGDLARDVQDDKAAPRGDATYTTWKRHLYDAGACDGAFEALALAFGEWREQQPVTEADLHAHKERIKELQQRAWDYLRGTQ